MSEEKKAEEVKKETSSVKTESTEKTSTGLTAQSKNMPFIAGGAFLVAVLILGVIGWFTFGSFNSQGEFGANNGLDESERYIEEGVVDVVSAMDFDNFGEDDVTDFIDIEKIIEQAEENSEKLGYFNSPSLEELEGKTVHSAMDASFELDSRDEMSGEISIDVYTEYSDDIDEEILEILESDDTEEILEFLEDLEAEDISELIGKIQIDAEGSLETEDGDIDFEASLFVDGLEAYAVLNSIELTGDLEEQGDAIKLYEGDVMKVDFEDTIDSYLEILGELPVDQLDTSDTEDIEEQLQEAYEDLLSELSDDEIELIQEAGPEVADIISSEIKDFDIFTNNKSVAPIRDNSNSKCSSSDLDIKGSVELLERIIEKSVNAIKDADSEDIVDFSDYDDEAEEDFEEFYEELDEIDPQFNVSLCNDKKSGDLTGFGIMGSFLGIDDEDDKLTFEYGMLVVDLDSDFEIEVPEEDLDLTDEFEESFGDLDSLFGGDTSDYDYDYDYDYGEYDEYYNEYSELSEQYSAGELTLDEYFDALDALDAEYGY